jgi:hypothetical protein
MEEKNTQISKGLVAGIKFILHLLSMHKKAGHLNLSLKHRSEYSRLGFLLNSQTHTNNIKDKGQKIKTHFFFLLNQ